MKLKTNGMLLYIIIVNMKSMFTCKFRKNHASLFSRITQKALQNKSNIMIITSLTDNKFSSQKNKFFYIHQVSVYR